jgi:DNA polymerase alpha-associated DNA helicase A
LESVLFQVCWIPILKGKKLILAGDPLQLPPTVMSTSMNISSQESSSAPPSGTIVKPTSNNNRQASPEREVEISSVSSRNDEGSSYDSDEEPSELSPRPDATVDQRAKPSAKSTLVSEGKKKRSAELRPSRSLEVTLFDRLERMRGQSIKRMLTVQYR